MKFVVEVLHVLRNYLFTWNTIPPLPHPPGGVVPPPKVYSWTNRRILLKFGTNGPLMCKDRLALSVLWISSPFPPSRGGFTPQKCIFELIDRFWLNLAQMVLSYVGIDWHFQFLNFLPLLPLEGGEGVTPPKVYFWSNRPIFMKFIIKLGTNGLHICRNRLVLSVFLFPPLPPWGGGTPKSVFLK